MHGTELLMTEGIHGQDMVLRESVGDRVTVKEGRQSRAADYWYSRFFDIKRKEVIAASPSAQEFKLTASRKRRSCTRKSKRFG